MFRALSGRCLSLKSQFRFSDLFRVQQRLKVPEWGLPRAISWLFAGRPLPKSEIDFFAAVLASKHSLMESERVLDVVKYLSK